MFLFFFQTFVFQVGILHLLFRWWNWGQLGILLLMFVFNLCLLEGNLEYTVSSILFYFFFTHAVVLLLLDLKPTAYLIYLMSYNTFRETLKWGPDLCASETISFQGLQTTKSSKIPVLGYTELHCISQQQLWLPALVSLTLWWWQSNSVDNHELFGGAEMGHGTPQPLFCFLSLILFLLRAPVRCDVM